MIPLKHKTDGFNSISTNCIRIAAMRTAKDGVIAVPFPRYNSGMDKNRFSQFEDRIQSLIEGSFARLFAGRLQPRDVALRLARIMEDESDLDDHGFLAAPNRYVAHLHPDDHAALLDAQPQLAAILAQHLVTLARDSDLRLDDAPEVSLLPDPGVALHALTIEAHHTTSGRLATQAMMAVDTAATEDHASPVLPQAFLVVNGDRYVPLDRTVINIGRRRDNTIVLDDRSVSRHHCQLRFRFGQFVLYDLASRGGTMVNQARVRECVLRSGDVISLAGVQVVYMVDEADTGGDTQAYPRDQDQTP